MLRVSNDFIAKIDGICDGTIFETRTSRCETFYVKITNCLENHFKNKNGH